MGELIVVGMAEEMYNDGLYYQGQARLENNEFSKWRFQRSAIICFATSFEAFANMYIVHILKSKSEKTPNEKDILRFLEKGDGKLPVDLRNINKKLRLMEKLSNLKTKTLSNSCFEKFREVINLRNNIVHYSHGRFSKFYGLKINEVSAYADHLLRELIFSYCFLLRIERPPYYMATNFLEIKSRF